MGEITEALNWISAYMCREVDLEATENHGTVYRTASGDVKQLPYQDPEPIHFSSVESFLAYLKKQSSIVDGDVCIQSRSFVRLETRTTHREVVVARAVAQGESKMMIGQMLLSEVPIYLQTCFEATAERDQLIDVLSHVEDGAVMSAEDNGIVQKVTVRSGAALRKVADVPNPVRLIPYRGFPEIENIPFRYVVRLHSVKDKLPTVSFTEVQDPLSDYAMRKSLAYYLAHCGFPVHW